MLSFQTVSKSYSDLINLERSSDQDKLEKYHIETAIFNLFKIDILNFIKAKAILAKEFHIQPSELEQMPAWEFEIFMKEINELVKEENERNKKQMDEAGIEKSKKFADPKYVENMQKNAMPKMDMNNFKMPAVVTPNFNF